jgi:hypothetical protein
MAALSLAMLCMAYLATGTVAAQTGQASDPATVVTAFIAAFNAQDLPATLAFLDPNFQYVSVPGSALPTNEGKGLGKGEFPGPLPFQQVTQSNIHPIDATNVEMDLLFSGGQIPVLPHPFRLHATFTVINGLITRLQDRLSDQTAQDLAALGSAPAAPAQLPNTGESDSSHGEWLLLLGVVCVLAGASAWRLSLSRR